ncbi:HU family DNA-binding protein [Haemophilus parahaemolyticus]|uniref:Integration host factor subunit beta n=1 Tax=Haemophilus parahaemolyticus TaxID=735 RepID=A0A369ZH08_HAEPH|nr:HU family DNA-binding protein [Haemophilus parahaemolyticus]MDQ6576393.1 HU family DNA-binding protein [Haemophilus parahaemolyticus]MDU4464391.1 HU family DNA-binding protein [Haemophilus parahaemolyticus]RDF03830.1 integration host factor subunit beta [Haemophilus parahaemolyticus]
MTKSELVANLTTLNPLLPSNLIEEGANEILEKIVSALAMGKRIEIRGFGSFSIRDREERVARNPKNGESVTLEAKTVAYFKAGKKLKECVDLV